MTGITGRVIMNSDGTRLQALQLVNYRDKRGNVVVGKSAFRFVVSKINLLK